MKSRTGWLLLLTGALLPATASAGTIALTSDEELCDNAPTLEGAVVLEAKRDGDAVTLAVTAQLNCAYVPGQPELREWRNAATVALPTTSPSGLATACLCAHELTFEISNLSDGVQTIYYVQDGTVLGHVNAP